MQLLYMVLNISIHLHKYTFIMRTVPNISEFLKPLDNSIDKFVRWLLNNYEFNSTERMLFSLPVKLGGLGILIPSQVSDFQYSNSIFITESLKNQVINQNHKLDEIDEYTVKMKKNEVKRKKNEKNISTLDNIKEMLSHQQRRILECVSEK